MSAGCRAAKVELFEVVAVFYFIFSRHRRETVRFSRIVKNQFSRNEIVIIGLKKRDYLYLIVSHLFRALAYPTPTSLSLCSIFVGTYYQCSFIESGTQSITSSSPTSKVVPKSRFLFFQRASTFVDSSTASCLFPIFLRLFFLLSTISNPGLESWLGAASLGSLALQDGRSAATTAAP